MIYEATINTVVVDEKGNDRSLKRQFILENFETFSEVEQKLYDEFGLEAGFEVCAIKISKIKEVANSRETADDNIYLAELQDTFVDDNGAEKQLKYKIAFHSKTFDTAKLFISNYAQQGYNLELVSLKLTKFIDVLS